MTKKILASGSKRDGLYALDNQGVVEAHFSHRFKRATIDIWHQRLGHPQARVVQHLQNNGFISINKTKSSPICASCEISKSVKLPFYASNNESCEPLFKTHFDLWGPAPFQSVQGFKYYDLFVDDFARFSWLYPLRQKSEFLNCFVNFHTFLEKKN